MYKISSKLVSKHWWIRLGIIFAVAIILLWFFFKDKETLLSLNWKLHWEYIIATFILFSLVLIGVSYVWSDIILTLGYRIDFKTHLYIFIVSNLIRRLPGTVWYVISRYSLYKGINVPGNVVVFASGIEFIISLVTSSFIALLTAPSLIPSFQLVILVCVIIFFVLLFLKPKIFQRLFSSEINLSAISLFKLVYWSILYAIIWASNGLLLWFITRIIVQVEPRYIYLTLSAVVLANMATSLTYFLPTNFGLTEISISAILSLILPSSVAVIIALISRILLTAYDFVWGLVMIIFLNKRINPKGLLTELGNK